MEGKHTHNSYKDYLFLYYLIGLSISRFLFMTWSVYILRCADGTYYTGCTNSIPQRLKRHANGEVLYTSKRLPVELMTYIVFNDKYKAYRFEKYLKSGSGKAFANKRFL